MILQPQPVGIFPGATAHLILLNLHSGDGSLTDHERASLARLLHGESCVDMPQHWLFFEFAAQGKIEQAINELCRLLQSIEVDQACAADRKQHLLQIIAYNQFVLSPTEDQFKLSKTSIVDGQLSELLQLVAFSFGLSDQAPQPYNLVNPELRAWALACCAAAYVEQENVLLARQCLEEAVDLTRLQSPLLCAILLSQSAQLAEQTQVPCGIVQRELEEAIELAKESQLPGFLAGLYAQLGMLLHRSTSENRSAMQAVIKYYQLALQSGMTAESSPLVFAELQNNLGLAYLSMPQTESSSQLRTGIAIQSFRRALEAASKETNAELWARVNMNLANALQYAPSSHPAENLIQAVELYEQVLEIRCRAKDPVAYALVILNQANALAHLGIFKPVLEKAAEAYKLFQWYNHADGASTARELVESVNHQIQAARNSETNNIPAELKELQHGLA